MNILNYKISLLLLMLPFLNSYGQSDSKYFYYYQGKKVSLEPDRQTIAISWEGDFNSARVTSLTASKKGKLSSIIEDHTGNNVVSVDQKALLSKNLKTYYFEVSSNLTNTPTDYERQIASYKSEPNVIMASPCFKFHDGKKMGLTNNLYVKLKSTADLELLYEQATKMNLEILGYNEFMPLWFTLSCGKSTKVNALTAANALHETGLFESAEPAFMYHDLSASNDPYFPNQWGLKNTGQYGSAYAGIDIKAVQAWTITSGAPSIKVAIYDHGFEMNHPDLMSNTHGSGYDANTGTSPSLVRGSHGTACAGIVGAVRDNNLGVSGVAPNAKLISISINLTFGDTPQSLANGFNWAWQNGADVISNSWGGYAPSGIIDNAITNTLTNGRGGKGTVIVFAAGNENNTNIRYPGNSNSKILLVGALSPCGERKNPGSCDIENWGSCYGTQLDIMAPGVKIPTTDRQGAAGYVPSDYTLTFNGTSSACPYVAGVVALVLSANPDLTVTQVTDIIEKTAQKTRTDLYSYSTTAGRFNGTWNNQMGYGLINAYEAVSLASTMNCPVDLTITTDVVAPTIETKKASNSITAMNVINSGAQAIYHAGKSVKLLSGFKSNQGATFKGYIEGCATASSEARIANSSDGDDDYNDISSTTEETVNAERNTIAVSPNPSSGNISIQTIFPENKKGRIVIYDMFGNKVYETSANEKASESYEINLSNNPAGIYMVHLQTENTVVQTKFILRK
jgi:subtilisin family serine protease